MLLGIYREGITTSYVKVAVGSGQLNSNQQNTTAHDTNTSILSQHIQ